MGQNAYKSFQSLPHTMHHIYPEFAVLVYLSRLRATSRFWAFLVPRCVAARTPHRTPSVPKNQTRNGRARSHRSHRQPHTTRGAAVVTSLMNTKLVGIYRAFVAIHREFHIPCIVQIVEAARGTHIDLRGRRTTENHRVIDQSPLSRRRHQIVGHTYIRVYEYIVYNSPWCGPHRYRIFVSIVDGCQWCVGFF